ncbi:MAG: ribosome silencing factor [Bacteroidia bacterium]|nr:ribosome silencing factor [Bacteroidia bacterium]
MAKKKKKLQSSSIVDAAIKGIQEKKGQNIVCIDLRKIENAVCEYFIICDGNSGTQVSAIADSIKEEVKKLTSEKPFHSEGYENSQWILIDYVTVVVHVFLPDVRRFYNLEDLWADAEILEYAE